MITASADAGTNYPIKITVHYGSGSDSTGNVYLNGKCKPDFGDIRFTSDDGITELSYWLDDKVDSDYAIFWVKITDDLSVTGSTIYIYYGAPTETTTSNGDNTFDFFDDFLGSSLDPTKWSADAGIIYSVADSKLTVTNCSINKWAIKYGFHHSGVPSQNKFAVMLKKFAWEQSDESPIWMSGIVLSNTFGFDYELSVYHLDAWTFQYGGKYARVKDYTYWFGYGMPKDGEAELEIRKDQNNNINIFWDSIPILGPQTNTTTLTEIFLLINRYLSYPYPTATHYDAVIWRKYVDPEPENGTWGSEETILIPCSIDVLLHDNSLSVYSIDTFIYQLGFKNYSIDEIMKRVCSSSKLVDTIFRKSFGKQYLINTLIKKLNITKTSSIDVILTPPTPIPPVPPIPCPTVLPTVYPHVSIYDTYNVVECNALAWNEEQECNVAIRPVPTREDGSFVDIGTYVFTPRKIAMKLRITNAQRIVLQAIFDAHNPVVVEAVAQGVYFTYYPVWLQKARKVWMYRDDGTWLIEITFYGVCEY